MKDSTLPELLRRLHEELGWADSLDDESRKLIKLVARDIEALSASSAAAGDHLPALERLAVRFDADHPALAAIARQLMDALAKAGI